MSRNWRVWLLLTVLTLGLLLAGCTPQSNGPDGDQPPLDPSPGKSPAASREVTLYFGDDQAMYLYPEKRSIQVEKSNTLPAEQVVKELIAGPTKDHLRPTLPPETKLLSVEVKDGTACVNFTEEIRTKHWGGSTGETMTLMSLVNSLTEFEEIDKVQILINGEKQDSLAGHWAISKPLERDESFLAE